MWSQDNHIREVVNHYEYLEMYSLPYNYILIALYIFRVIFIIVSDAQL